MKNKIVKAFVFPSLIRECGLEMKRKPFKTSLSQPIQENASWLAMNYKQLKALVSHHFHGNVELQTFENLSFLIFHEVKVTYKRFKSLVFHLL